MSGDKKMTMELSDDQLLRYSRQIMLPAFDYAGQQALLESNILIIGAGGLGCPAALYLAGAGVGKMTLVDGDSVDVTNLHRQIAHRTEDIGRPKVESLQRAMKARAPDVSVSAISAFVDDVWLDAHIRTFDLVVDCTDNFTTRYLINQVCVQHSIPLVSGAAIRMEGQVSVFDFRRQDAACYACLYPPSEDQQELTCSQAGVMGPLVGVVGTVQALEAIKLLSGLGVPLTNKLLVLDAMMMQWRQLALKRDAGCPVCGKGTKR